MRINAMTQLKTEFIEHVGIDFSIICGPMYPCSNPELVAAVSESVELFNLTVENQEG
jgi:NAD(P)H-dependent flavin oxidoreductase YrpB (nitropropane dioxygenase family)